MLMIKAVLFHIEWLLKNKTKQNKTENKTKQNKKQKPGEMWIAQVYWD